MKGYKCSHCWARLDLEGFHLYSCYISPNIDINSFEAILNEIMNDVQNTGDEVIITGDFNAKSSLWGSPHTDSRGEKIGDWTNVLNLIIQNDGRPTFVRGQSVSHIDLSLTTSKISRKVGGWEILEEDSMSLHKYIIFNLHTDHRINGYGETREIHFDLIKYKEELTKEIQASSGKSPLDFAKAIGRAQKKIHVPQTKQDHNSAILVERHH